MRRKVLQWYAFSNIVWSCGSLMLDFRKPVLLSRSISTRFLASMQFIARSAILLDVLVTFSGVRTFIAQQRCWSSPKTRVNPPGMNITKYTKVAKSIISRHFKIPRTQRRTALSVTCQCTWQVSLASTIRHTYPWTHRRRVRACTMVTIERLVLLLFS